MYAIGGSQNPTILSEGNRFTAPDDDNSKEVRQDKLNLAYKLHVALSSSPAFQLHKWNL